MATWSETGSFGGFFDGRKEKVLGSGLVSFDRTDDIFGVVMRVLNTFFVSRVLIEVMVFLMVL